MSWSELAPLLEQAALLMVMGMVVVFAILGLMVWLISSLSRLLLRWLPVVDDAPVALPSAAAAGPTAAEVAAIGAAVHQHRQHSAKEYQS